jgi:subtilisin family serine protease
VQALVPAAGLAALAADPAVGHVDAPVRPAVDALDGEGGRLDGRSALADVGYTGNGGKVAVIDAGFAGYRDAQASGEPPASATLVDDCGGELESGGVEHGTAVAEIVHEVAPGAVLYLICVDSPVTLAVAEQYAKANGILIVHQRAAAPDAAPCAARGCTGALPRAASMRCGRRHTLAWPGAAPEGASFTAGL